MKHLTLAESTYDKIIDGVNDGLTVWHLRKNTLRRLGVTSRGFLVGSLFDVNGNFLHDVVIACKVVVACEGENNAVSDRVPVRTYDFQNLVKGYKS